MKRSEPSSGLGRSARLARRFSLSLFLNHRAWSQATQSVLEVKFSTTGTSELWILRNDHSCKLPLPYSYCCCSLLLLLLLLSLNVLFFVFLCYVNILIITACVVVVVVVFSFVCLFVCFCFCSGLKINLGLSPVVLTCQRNFSSITTLFLAGQSVKPPWHDDNVNVLA